MIHSTCPASYDCMQNIVVIPSRCCDAFDSPYILRFMSDRPPTPSRSVRVSGYRVQCIGAVRATSPREFLFPCLPLGFLTLAHPRSLVLRRGRPSVRASLLQNRESRFGQAVITTSPRTACTFRIRSLISNRPSRVAPSAPSRLSAICRLRDKTWRNVPMISSADPLMPGPSFQRYYLRFQQKIP